MGAEPESHDLRADDHQQGAGDHRVDAPCPPEDVDLRDHRRRDQRADHGQHQPGHHEEVGGAVDEQEAQVAPAVAKARELGLAAAWVVLDRELRDPQLLLGGPDDHLRSELHARRAQVEDREDVAPEAAHAAVRVRHPGLEEDVQDPGEDRVADVAVQPGHRARMDVVHAVAHDQLGALVELGDEAWDLGEVVREVGVGHHDVLAASRGETGQVRAAVAGARLVHDAGAGLLGERAAAVRRVVVGNDDLARKATGLDGCQSALHALLDVLGLVEAGDHDRDLRRRRRRRQEGARWAARACSSEPVESSVAVRCPSWVDGCWRRWCS